MPKNPKQQTSPMRFESMPQTDVPKGRDGKHKVIIEQLLSDLNHLEEGNALKIPLSALPDSKENIRSALSRATRQKGHRHCYFQRRRISLCVEDGRQFDRKRQWKQASAAQPAEWRVATVTRQAPGSRRLYLERRGREKSG